MAASLESGETFSVATHVAPYKTSRNGNLEDPN
jgi:hypothetical protein